MLFRVGDWPRWLCISIAIFTNGLGFAIVTIGIVNLFVDLPDDVLGSWISEKEGAHFWQKVMSDLKSRGAEDILIACVDGLKGFPEAIEAIFPRTLVQLCVVHQIRTSLRYLATKHEKFQKVVDLKKET